MLILVMGGSGSGKSGYAERRCMELTRGKKWYIATMESADAESDRRIARHRRLRDGKGFETLECPTHLEDVKVPSGSTVLLECMSNLVANEMFSASGRWADIKEVIMGGVARLCNCAEHTVIVTNQVFSDGVAYDEETERYMRILAAINQEIAATADEVTEVVCGIPIMLRENIPHKIGRIQADGGLQ